MSQVPSIDAIKAKFPNATGTQLRLIQDYVANPTFTTLSALNNSGIATPTFDQMAAINSWTPQAPSGPPAGASGTDQDPREILKQYGGQNPFRPLTPEQAKQWGMSDADYQRYQELQHRWDVGQQIGEDRSQGIQDQAQSWYDNGDPLLSTLNGARTAGYFAPDAALTRFNDTLNASNARGDAAMQSALTELKTPDNINIGGNYARDIGQLSNIPEVDLDTAYNNQIANIGRSANYNARSNAKNVGASMTSRGLAGSGAYNNAIGNVYADANRTMASTQADMATQLANQKLNQRQQNINIGTTKAGIGQAYTGMDLTQRGQNIGLQGQRAGVQQAQGQNYYSQALPAAQAGVTNMYTPINQAANASGLFYNTATSGIPTGNPPSMSLLDLLSKVSPYYSSAGNQETAGYANANDLLKLYVQSLLTPTPQGQPFDIGGAVGTGVNAADTVIGWF